MKTKIYSYLCLALVLIFMACDNSDSESVKEIRFKLEADKTFISPLEPISIRLVPDIDELVDTYDEIRWEANGSFWDGYITIGGKQENSFEFTDYKPGKHKIVGYGYKDDVLISESSIEYEVVNPKGDFMHLEWGAEESKSYSYRPPVKKIEGDVEKYFRIVLSLYHDPKAYNNGVWYEYAELDLMPWTYTFSRSSERNVIELPDIYGFDWLPYDGYDREILAQNYKKRNEFEYALLNGMITNYYGYPAFEYVGKDATQTDLIEEYNKRFKRPLYDNYPTKIWETSSSYIALIQNSGEVNGENYNIVVTIVAEPRNK